MSEYGIFSNLLEGEITNRKKQLIQHRKSEEDKEKAKHKISRHLDSQEKYIQKEKRISNKKRKIGRDTDDKNMINSASVNNQNMLRMDKNIANTKREIHNPQTLKSVARNTAKNESALPFV